MTVFSDDTASPPVALSGIRSLMDRYDGFILDVWGVLHNGVEPYPGVIDALERLTTAGKRISLLSNAPARADMVISRILSVGIPAHFFHEVVSSGEEVWQNLRDRTDPFYAALGPHCVYLGPNRHTGMLKNVDFTLVDTPVPGSFILNTGPDDLDEAATKYRPMLEKALANDVPMICANADLHVMIGTEVIACAGTLALRYEEMGGRVRWHGKPHRSVYDWSFDLLRVPDRGRILAVGDSLRTDIAGAVAAGIDCALVFGGIHAGELEWQEDAQPAPEELKIFLRDGPLPTWLLPGLMW